MKSKSTVVIDAGPHRLPFPPLQIILALIDFLFSRRKLL